VFETPDIQRNLGGIKHTDRMMLRITQACVLYVIIVTSRHTLRLRVFRHGGPASRSREGTACGDSVTIHPVNSLGATCASRLAQRRKDICTAVISRVKVTRREPPRERTERGFLTLFLRKSGINLYHPNILKDFSDEPRSGCLVVR
jgi:hypothetical protein